jgi:beta-N-acetylhexosaminidase
MPAASSSVAEPAGDLPAAAIVGVAGAELGVAERALFRAHPPFGFILFARNCVDPAQVRRLTLDLRAAVGRADAPVLIDQEGGRVARLGPPHWPARGAARPIGRLAERDPGAGREAAWLHARLIAADLEPLGITVDCVPVLDLALADRTAAIGDRALSADPALVGELGRAMIEGLLAGGVLPVIKHLPGHGRARVDSHEALPVVDARVEQLRATDWQPFRTCRSAPLAMTAHVLYPALDPDRPATLSPRIIADVIRGELGITGALLSDDLSMGALAGRIGERTAAARAAGCDLALHCNGRSAETVDVLAAAGPLAGLAKDRAERALRQRHLPEPLDRSAAEARLLALLAGVEPALQPGT